MPRRPSAKKAPAKPTADEAWREIMAQVGDATLFLDTPAGKSVFAHGAAFALQRLGQDFTVEGWDRLHDELLAFSEAYMERSRNG